MTKGCFSIWQNCHEDRLENLYRYEYSHSNVRILVVEDERKIARFIRQGLEEQGFAAEICGNGDEAFALITSRAYDAIVLDIMLPGRDGLSILRNLRERRNTVPVIVLTARTELNERVDGLNLGADDYLTKPFYIEELIARIQAVTRRAKGEQLSVLQVDDLIVNLITRQVRRGERDVELTAREFSLLERLMRAPERVFTRTQLLEHVWGYDFDPETNLVDVNIRRLRKKIDEGSRLPLIETVRGVGYRIRKPE
jgi:two-component system, OmpR family, response regulator